MSYFKFETLKSSFCHQNTKAPNSTKVKVLIMSLGVPNFWDWWPGVLVAFLFVIIRRS